MLISRNKWKGEEADALQRELHFCLSVSLPCNLLSSYFNPTLPHHPLHSCLFVFLVIRRNAPVCTRVSYSVNQLYISVDQASSDKPLPDETQYTPPAATQDSHSSEKLFQTGSCSLIEFLSEPASARVASSCNLVKTSFIRLERECAMVIFH